MKTSVTLSVIVPLYNSASCLDTLVRELREVLADYFYEIILIDDGSKDAVWEKVLALKKELGSSLKSIRLSRNYGQQRATFCGLSRAGGDIIITIDDDMSHPVEYLPQLIEQFQREQMDILYVIPEKYHYPWYRKVLSLVYKRLSRYENPDAGKGSSFRIMSRALVQSIVSHSSHLIVIDEFVLWYTQSIRAVEYPFRASKKNKSRYSCSRLFHLSKNTLMISTTMPLILVKVCGFIVAFFSLLAGVYYLVQKFVFHYAEKGYTSIIVSILFGVGLIMFSLGIIGEYIAYILMDVHKKPPYHIKEEL